VLADPGGQPLGQVEVGSMSLRSAPASTGTYSYLCGSMAMLSAWLSAAGQLAATDGPACGAMMNSDDTRTALTRW
jgi:hypothetical protein